MAKAESKERSHGIFVVGRRPVCLEHSTPFTCGFGTLFWKLYASFKIIFFYLFFISQLGQHLLRSVDRWQVYF